MASRAYLKKIDEAHSARQTANTHPNTDLRHPVTGLHAWQKAIPAAPAPEFVPPVEPKVEVKSTPRTK
jgi:hypothetical protein